MNRVLGKFGNGHGVGIGTGPLRTMTEMADEFGVCAKRLGRLMAADPLSPRAVRDNTNKGTAQRVKWYRPKEVREWWAKRAPTPETAQGA